MADHMQPYKELLDKVISALDQIRDLDDYSHITGVVMDDQEAEDTQVALGFAEQRYDDARKELLTYIEDTVDWA